MIPFFEIMSPLAIIERIIAFFFILFIIFFLTVIIFWFRQTRRVPTVHLIWNTMRLTLKFFPAMFVYRVKMVPVRVRKNILKRKKVTEPSAPVFKTKKMVNTKKSPAKNSRGQKKK